MNLIFLNPFLYFRIKKAFIIILVFIKYKIARGKNYEKTFS